MFNLTSHNEILPAMSDDSIAKVYAFESETEKMIQIPVEIKQTLHSGVYTRTAIIPKDTIITGALIRIPTTLIVSGKTTVYIGSRIIQLDGYNVVQAEGNRKQIFIAHETLYLTMIFATDAKTFEEAERQFTLEYAKLTTRNDKCLE